MIFHANTNQKKTCVAMLISDKVDIKGKSTPKDKDT